MKHNLGFCYDSVILTLTIILDHWSALRYWARSTSTSIYWRPCGPKAEQLGKTRKGL